VLFAELLLDATLLKLFNLLAAGHYRSCQHRSMQLWL
jgi:hypothetical protein